MIATRIAGSTARVATRAMTIINAVSKPYAANSGIGAKARIPNPVAELTADATSASPVPSPATRTAVSRRPWMASSSR